MVEKESSMHLDKLSDQQWIMVHTQLRRLVSSMRTLPVLMKLKNLCFLTEVARIRNWTVEGPSSMLDGFAVFHAIYNGTGSFGCFEAPRT